MRGWTGWRGWRALVALALAAPAGTLRAQEIPPPALALVGGVAQYDLNGTGTEGFVGLRLDLPMSDYIFAEPGFVYMSYRSQGGDLIRHLTAEVQIQGSYPFGIWRPFLGAGAGGFFDVRKQRGGAQLARPTFSGAAGTRVHLTGNLGARAELRVRGIGKGFNGTIAEWSGGLSWSF